MQFHTGDAIPEDILQKWQRIVDLLARIVRVPSAVVTSVEPDTCTCYETIVSSRSQGNPFPIEQLFGMDIGTFCETVIKTRQPLLVANALEDVAWKTAPETHVGMISYLGYPVFWPDGRVFGTICVLDDKANGYNELYQELLSHCRDVLQGDLRTLVRVNSELDEQRAHLQELFARVPEAIVMIDRESRVTRVNPEFTRMFGYAPDEALGQPIRALITPDDLIEETEGIVRRMTDSREVFAVTTVRQCKQGRRIPVLLLCVPLSSNVSGDAGFLIYRDLTEARRLQDEQRRSHELQLELAHANRIATVGQLSAAIAHELNQPVTGVIMNSQTCLGLLARDSADLDGVQAGVQRILRDGVRASEIIARLRALFAKRERAADAVDLNEATREVLALVQGELDRSRVVLRSEFCDDLPCVTGDRVQLQQVVLNMVRNALDAMKDVLGRPRELLVRTALDAGGVTLSVTDSGVGVAPDALHRLFDAFYSTKHDGMGVGLSVSRSIVESHGGCLSVKVNDGPGATFSMSIPPPAGDNSAASSTV